MAPYTNLQVSDIHKIAGKFDLNVIGYEPIEQGLGNSNFLINTGKGKHILTVFEIEPLRVTQICRILLLLEMHDFPAPRLQFTSTGKMKTKFQEKSVLIKRYIPGKVLEDLNEGQVAQIGTALAKLHEIPAPNYLPDKHAYLEETYPQVMEQEIDRVYKQWVKKRHQNIVANLHPKLPVGIVHGDLFCDNVLFEGEKFKAILDFEEVSRNYKVLDLGMAIVGICTDDTEIVTNKAKALVAGYQKIRRLEVTEIDSLQDFVEWAAILTSIWRFWKYNIDMPDIEEERKHTQMIDIAKNIRTISKDKFKMAILS